MNDETNYESEIDNNVDIPKEKRKLETNSYDYSVEFIYNYIKSGKIILEVPFQRKFIWKPDRSSKLIESIIMNVPIPPIYLAEEKDGKWLVIDGLQRLSAVKAFYENEFNLESLEIVKELITNKYKDLPPKAKSLLDDGMLRIIVIKKDSHPDIKFDIFMRLNNGAVNLNDQELRNCLYRGELIELAKKLSGNSNFLRILKQSEPDSRYIDAEFIIRYISFLDNIIEKDGDYSVNKYDTSIKSYLNNYLENNRNPSSDKIIKIEKTFIESLSKLLYLFSPDELFRDPQSKSKKINKALADCLLIGVGYVTLDNLKKDKDKYKDQLIALIKDELQEYIRGKTSNTTQVNTRISKAIKYFKAI